MTRRAVKGAIVGREVRRIRGALELTQGELGALLGVHPLTVSKWERGELWVGPYHGAILVAFYQAGPEVAREAVRALSVAGIVAALRLLLAESGELEEEEAPPVWFGRGELEEGLGDG